MKEITVRIKAISQFSFNKATTPMPDNFEPGYDVWEKQTWRERMTVNDKGNIVVSPQAITKGLEAACKYRPRSVPGHGKSTYTKHFKGGIFMSEPIVLPFKAAEVTCEALFVPSNGKPGSGSRVMKYFPVIPPGWEADFKLYVLDDLIGQEILTFYLETIGKFIGIGRFRPEHGGFYGRFDVVKVTWPKDNAKGVAA